ncbi:MAG: hypothetical protein LKI39_14765 [Bacteroides sp.]|jgi:hypothetical protein|nr:hypothetical protein [Bacteroides sp.]
MNLKDFIKSTISEISSAVIELKAENESTGLIVNPRDIGGPYIIGVVDDKREVSRIDFNLTVSEEDTIDSGGGIKINVLNAGLNNKNSNQAVNTVSFSILVAYP